MEPYVAPAAPDRRRWWWGAAWVALVAAIAGSAIAIADGQQAPDGALAEVIAYVREHRTARFETESTSRVEPPPGWPEDLAGDTFPREHRSRSTGHLDIAGLVATVTVHEGSTYERIELPEGSYSRAGGMGWVFNARRDTSRDQTELLEGQLEVEAAGDGDGGWTSLTSSSGGMPDELLTEVARIGTVVGDGPGRLRVTYRTRDLLDAEDRALFDRVRDEYFRRPFDAERRVVVVHGDDGRLDAIHEEGDGSTSVTRYTEWGAPVDIQPPPEDQVDRTPAIEEEELAAYRPGPLVAPTDLPDGWALQSGRVYLRDVVEEELDSECARADLGYGVEGSYETGASVVLIEPDCPYLDAQLDLEDGERAKFGPYDAILHDAWDFNWYVDSWGDDDLGAAVRLPQGWVLVTTSEGPDVLARLVASLAPYDSAANASGTVKAPS